VEVDKMEAAPPLTTPGWDAGTGDGYSLRYGVWLSISVYSAALDDRERGSWARILVPSSTACPMWD